MEGVTQRFYQHRVPPRAGGDKIRRAYGSLLFLIGSVLGFWNTPAIVYAASFTFGVGSVIFAFGSAAQIVMWKDEQFGLCFLAALNNLGGPNGRPMVLTEPASQVQETATFSVRGTIFIMVFISAATVSVYNFTTSMAEIGSSSGESAWFSMYRSFNALLPCIFAHFLLGLNAGVIKTPKSAPFHQLYIACRFLALVMVVIGTAELSETLSSRNPHLRPDERPLFSKVPM